MSFRSSVEGSRSSIWMIASLMALSLFFACSRQSEYAPPPPPEVTVEKPVMERVTDYAEFTGLLDAAESVEIRARVEGFLESVRFQPGMRVQEGDLLFTIDPRPFQARLEEARAELERRQAELKQVEATLKRKELAFKARAVSEVEIINERADRDVAKAAIQSALAAIEVAELNLSYTQIRAPMSGRISRNLVDIGNLVGASERTLLATIVRDDPIYAYFNINERDLLFYQQHHGSGISPANGDGTTPVQLGLSNQQGYPYEGYIDYIGNRLDPSTGTVQVRGVFPNPDGLLWPGLFARIRVPVSEWENAMLVPDVALGTDQRGEYLLVVNDENRVELRPVATGPLEGTMRVIVTGISPDDRVIVSGLQRARPGIEVAPVEAAARPSDPVDVEASPDPERSNPDGPG